MVIKRFYTKEGFDPHVDIKWKQVSSKIAEPNGKLIFEMNDVEVPEQWLQTATDILAQKYFRKTGVPKYLEHVKEENVPSWLRASTPDMLRINLMEATKNNKEKGFGSETSAHQIFHRLAGCWTYWGWKAKYFDSEKDAKAFYDEVYYILAMQIGAPNSPQWFNTGLNWAYGITGSSQGHYYVDYQTGELKESEDAYSHPQPHACFIQSIDDHLIAEGGIMDLWHKEARLFKYGSGTGTNFSNLRGKGEPLEGGGTSSGLMSFLEIGDKAAGAIKSGGTCLTVRTPVLTEAGWVPAGELVNKRFLVLSKDLQTGKISAKWATAFKSGLKKIIKTRTDKGEYETSYDHPFLLKSSDYCEAQNLFKGQRLDKIVVDTVQKYPVVIVPPDYDHRKPFHQFVAEFKYGDIKGKIPHHEDTNTFNNHPDNILLL